MAAAAAAREVDWEEAAPLVLISHGGEKGEDYSKHSFYKVWKDELICSTSIRMLLNKRIIASTHGWLVLVNINGGDGDGDCWVWNPISMDTIIPLPPLQHRSQYHACLITKPPTHPKYHLLFLHQSRSKLAYCAIGDQCFTTQTLHHDILAVGLFHDRIYGVQADGERYSLVSIDFVGNGRPLELRPLIFELERFNISSRPWHGNARIDAYLVACDDDDREDSMFLVRMSEFHHCREFRVFRLHPDTRECVEVNDIGGRTIFIGEAAAATGFCCRSSNKMVNCIYYMRGKWHEGSSLYLYNLDGSTTPLRPLPRVHPTFCMATWLQRPSSRHLLLHHSS